MPTQSCRDPHFEQEIQYNKVVELVFLTVLLLLLAAHLTVIGRGISQGRIPFQAMTYIFSSLVLLHGVYMFGWRRALCFFLLTLPTAFLFEHVGVKTGWVFGHYHYTDVLDPKLLGTVPVVIPLAYFMVIYPSYMMANLILRGRPTGKFQGWDLIVLTSLLTALIMTAWDLVMDPVMVHDVKAWVWERGGDYFGVPYHNFFGWTLTTFTVSALFRALEQSPWIPMRPYGRSHTTFLVLPLLGYGALMVGAPFVGVPVDTRAISPFAMGIPLLAALMRLYANG
jgi:putative membrane protein